MYANSGIRNEELCKYLRVSEDENDSRAVEIPCELDGTVLLSTLVAVFPGACGLKFRHGGVCVRGVRLSEGKLHPATTLGWGKHLYFCVFPKENKRKMEDVSPENSAAKTKRLEKKLTCTDLICLGLPWTTSEESLKSYFEIFGEVVMVQLKKDGNGAFKGFAFIRFATYTSQVRALAQRHYIGGRWVDVRIPFSKKGVVPQMPCKVFIGRCTEEITADDLREYFSKFGVVTDVFVPRPFRAFGFVTFLEPEVAQGLCGEDHVIKGASVSISSAAPKVKNKTNQNYRQNGWENRSGPSGVPSGDGAYNNIDSLNMQNLGINRPELNHPNYNLPIGLVTPNQAGWGGFLGAPGNTGPNDWQGSQGNSGQNWNNHTWSSQNGPQSWNQGNQGWNREGGNWNQGNWNQGNWNQGNWSNGPNWNGNGNSGSSAGWNNMP